MIPKQEVKWILSWEISVLNLNQRAFWNSSDPGIFFEHFLKSIAVLKKQAETLPEDNNAHSFLKHLQWICGEYKMRLLCHTLMWILLGKRNTFLNMESTKDQNIEYLVDKLCNSIRIMSLINERGDWATNQRLISNDFKSYRGRPIPSSYNKYFSYKLVAVGWLC